MKTNRFYEILKKDFFNKEIIVSSTDYIARKDGEFYCTHIMLPDGEEKKYLGKGSTKKMTMWMDMLGFSSTEKPSQVHFSLLNLKNSAILLKKCNLSQADIVFHADNFLFTYVNELSNCPFIQIYFKYVYEILFNCYSIDLIETSGFNILSIHTACEALCSDIDYIIENIPLWHEYVLQAITKPYENKIIRKPSLYFKTYDATLAVSKKYNPYAEACFLYYSSYPDVQLIAEDTVYDDNTENSDDEILVLLESDNIIVRDDFRFLGQFVSGINYLIETDTIIKKCDCCQKYFLCKYTSKTVFCTYPYKGKANCQEYMAQKRHRQKQSEDPFYKAYNRIYRRIYSRLRRGSISNEDAKLDELLELKNVFLAKYQTADSSDMQYEIIALFSAEAEKMYSSTPQRRGRISRKLETFD